MKTFGPTLRLFTAFILCAGLILAACSKNRETSVQSNQPTNTQLALQTEATTEEAFDDIFNNVMGVSPSIAIGETGVFEGTNPQSPGSLYPSQNTCFAMTVDFLNQPDTFPVRITLDFGTGCTGPDGRVRKGKMITTYSAQLLKPGSVAETSFDGYSIDGMQVEGTHRIENKSITNQPIFETKVINGKLTMSNGDYIVWNRTRTVTQTDGYMTPTNPYDDSFTIEGNGSGSVVKSTGTVNWTSTNIEPLVKKFDCHWIVKGKQAIQRNDGPQGVIDFGNGDCDNKAVITVNGVSAEITLK